MSNGCASKGCNRKVNATCHCCQQPFCRDHFREHDELLKNESNPLTDQFNSVHNRIVELKVDDLIAPGRQQLGLWRDDCVQKVNEIYRQKCHELEQRAKAKIEKLNKDTKDLRETLHTFIQNQDFDRETIASRKADIENVEQVLNILENRAFQITIKPTNLDQTLVGIEEVNEYHMKLLALGSIHKSISCAEGSYGSIASSGQFLLYHSKPNLCLLNKNLEEVKRNAWKNKDIQSMCWSPKLKQFIVINIHEIFVVDENLSTIKRVQIIKNRDLYACTCSNESLFISTYNRGSPVLEYQLSPEIKFVKEWTSPHTCQQDEWINDISYYGESIAMIIKNVKDNSFRLELLNPNDFKRIWKHQIEVQYTENKTLKLCLLMDNGWFVIDRGEHQVLYIAKDGIMKANQGYNETIRYASMFGPDLLAITTKKGIHFHKF